MENALVGIVPVLQRRADVAPAAFSAYWRDIHGVFVSTLPGPLRYTQYHLLHQLEGAWNGSAQAAPRKREEQLSGLAVFVFPSSDAKRRWERSVSEFADADDGNVFSRSASYSVSQGGFIKAEELAVHYNVENAEAHLLVMFKAKDGVEIDQLIHGELPSLARESGTVRLIRTILLNPFCKSKRVENTNPRADRSLDAHEIHDAIVEHAFFNSAAQAKFFADHYPILAAKLERSISRIDVYPVETAQELISEGSVTLSGWLGRDRAALIGEVAADNIIADLGVFNARRSAAMTD